MASKRMHKYTMRKDNRPMAGGENDLPVASRAGRAEFYTAAVRSGRKDLESESVFFCFRQATGDLYLIPSAAPYLPSALCLSQPLLPPPPFYSSAPPPSFPPSPACDSFPVPSAACCFRYLQQCSGFRARRGFSWPVSSAQVASRDR